MTTDPKPTLAAADAVLGELLSRGGFDDWWGDIDQYVRDEIRWTLARVIANATPPAAEGELLVAEHICGIDPDERQRAHVLDCAAHWHIGSTLADEDAGPATVIATARAFEAYLRGDR